MSDMRNFDDKPENDKPGSGTMSENIRRDEPIGKHQGFYDNGGLSSFHRIEQPEETSGSARLIGASVVVLMLIGAGVYAYTSSGGSPVPNSSLPQPSAPKSVAANTPPPIQTAPVTTPAPSSDNSALANSPYGAAPANTPSSAPGSDMAAGASDTSVTKGAPDTSATKDTAAREPRPIRTAHTRSRKHKKEAADNVQEAQETHQLNAQEDQTVSRQNQASEAATPPSSPTATASATANPPATAVPPADSGSTIPNSPTAGGSMASNGGSVSGAAGTGTQAGPAAQSTALPTPPSPPASSMASNGQTANGATANGATTPAAPAPETSAPAQSQQPDQSAASQQQPQQ